MHNELLDYRNILTTYDLQHIHLPHHFDENEIAARNARSPTYVRAQKLVISVFDFKNTRNFLPKIELRRKTCLPSGIF